MRKWNANEGVRWNFVVEGIRLSREAVQRGLGGTIQEFEGQGLGGSRIGGVW